jgi:1-acyl-sn-glycerol-3-phosphate acyltransferase
VLDGERPESDPTRVVRFGRRGRRIRRGENTPGVVIERLGEIERKVETSLAGERNGGGLRDSVWLTVDGWLERYARLRRWLNWEGFVPSGGALGALPLLALYRLWWRVDAVGLERIPATGPVLLVANRAGTLLPYDAFMVAVALAMDHPAGRRTRPLVDEWLTQLPLIGPALLRLGAEPVTAPRLRRRLAAGDAVVTFPEGRDAFAKSFAHRYRLARFGRTALLRTAIELETPIVPVAVIGSEETHPVLWRFEQGGRALGLPALPITPTLLPLPTKWTLHVGQPLEPGNLLRGGGSLADTVKFVRTQVRERLQGLVSEGLGRRRSVFLA